MIVQYIREEKMVQVEEDVGVWQHAIVDMGWEKYVTSLRTTICANWKTWRHRGSGRIPLVQAEVYPRPAATRQHPAFLGFWRLFSAHPQLFDSADSQQGPHHTWPHHKTHCRTGVLHHVRLPQVLRQSRPELQVMPKSTTPSGWLKGTLGKKKMDKLKFSKFYRAIICACFDDKSIKIH